MTEVSIILITYNRAHLIQRAIQSVLDQTMTDFELIVVDDVSTDKTEAVVKSFGDARIKYVKSSNQSKHCLGIPRNIGVAEATSNLITFIDDDNAYKPTFLETLYKEMVMLQPVVDVIYCDSEYFKDGKSIGVIRSEVATKEKLKIGNVVDIGEVIIRKEAFIKYGMFDETLANCGEDWELFLRFALKGAIFGHLPIALTNYYQHAEQGTLNPEHHKTIEEIHRRIGSGYYA